MQDFPSELQTLLEISRTPCINIRLTNQKTTFTPDTKSKVSGLGYLPMGEAYPVGKSGKPLTMLAQINFAQVASAVDLTDLPHPLPTTGILQFYIALDDDVAWGLDDNHPPVDEQSKDFQIRYWQEIHNELNLDELAKARVFLQSCVGDDDIYIPFELGCEYLMSFNKQLQSCTPSCYELVDFATKVGFQKKRLWDYQDEFVDYYLSQANVFFDGYNDTSIRHQLLGYPEFCQDDPRFYDDNKLQEYILLFQLDSEYFDDVEILWGDSGIANFFIHPDDLAKGDFSKVFYHWDCS